MAAPASRVLLDLNTPEFLDVLLGLEKTEAHQVLGALDRIRKLTWTEVHRHPGLKWEALAHVTAPNGSKVHSVRMSQKIRALAYRDGAFMRFVSLHPDHDSAYG